MLKNQKKGICACACTQRYVCIYMDICIFMYISIMDICICYNGKESEKRYISVSIDMCMYIYPHTHTERYVYISESRMCVCVCVSENLNHFAIYPKITPYCKPTMVNFKKNNRIFETHFTKAITFDIFTYSMNVFMAPQSHSLSIY